MTLSPNLSFLSNVCDNPAMDVPVAMLGEVLWLVGAVMVDLFPWCLPGRT